MPDVGLPPEPQTVAAPPRRRWVSPLLRRILLLNVLPPALLAAAMLYLDQYQNGLLAAEVEALRTQARIYAGGIAEARSEEHTSELQSRQYLVCRLLLEKKRMRFVRRELLILSMILVV